MQSFLPPRRRLATEDREYCAAGVFPLRRNPETQELEVLLASEKTEGTRRCRYFTMPGGCFDGLQCEYPHLETHTVPTPDEKPAMRLNPLGGKREDFEQESSLTAAREFQEETNFDLITKEEALAFVQQSQVQCVRLYGAYDLYIAPLQPHLTTNLAEAYARLSERHPYLTCAEALYWIPVSSLLNVQWDDVLGYHIVDHSDSFLMPTYLISNLLLCLCQKKREVLSKLL